MIFQENSLKDKRILVTGASSGIGRACAQMFAACGAELLICGRDQERLLATLSSLHGKEHKMLLCDLDGSDHVVELIQDHVRDAESLDGILHAAGISMVRPVKLSKEKQFDEVFTSSIKSAVALARAASLKGVMNNGGSITLMSSVAAVRGQAGMSLYSSAKAAIEGLSRSLAVEFAPRGIRVNAIAAGAVKTEMHARLLQGLSPESVAEYEGKHLLGFGETIDIAHAATFLMSDAGRWMTGASLVLDGGYTVR